jgi:glycosyltransferase involved in cell wall biosynthesis
MASIATSKTLRAGVVLFLPTFGDGGVERNFVYLANGLVEAGCPVLLVTCCETGAFLDRLHDAVRRLTLPPASDAELTAQLLRVLDDEQPAIVMTGQQRDDAIALAAKAKARPGTRIFLNVGTPLSEQSKAAHRFGPSRWLHRRHLRQLFERCDGIIANSHGVARDLTEFLEVPAERIAVAPNPAVAPDLAELAAEPVEHPWLQDGVVPVIMGAGRLGRVKDFPTLLRAFARLRAKQACRLMILGRGRQAAKLERLARELGVERDFELTGFVGNPYGYLARARVFVVSSLREGGPNVLMEALACGTPCVATDCPHGPREILDGGRYGELVPVGDADALAAAIDRAIRNPPGKDALREAAQRFSVDNSARAYLQAFGLSSMSHREP